MNSKMYKSINLRSDLSENRKKKNKQIWKIEDKTKKRKQSKLEVIK